MARAVHDMGGLPAGPIDRSEHVLTPFEKRIDAMLMLLVHPDQSAFNVDALRRAIESYTEQDYDSLSYYERWLGAIKELVIEQRILSEDEIAQRIAEIRRRAGEGAREA